MTDEWINGEGDAYYDRNEDAPVYNEFDLDNDYAWQMLKSCGVLDKQNTVLLDIGCGPNATRLTALKNRLGSSLAVGVDASRKTISSLPHNIVGMNKQAHEFRLSFQADIILCCYCLHWVDRQQLMLTLANIDYHLADGGLLFISDFEPITADREAVPYAHKDGLFTYKDDYPTMFTATGCYEELIYDGLDHDTLELGGCDSYCAVLRKGYVGEETEL